MGSLSSEQWVVEVKGSRRQALELDGDIYELVPKSLKNENTVIFYVPQVISFGPFHFQRKSPLRDEIEVLKSAVARNYDNLEHGLLDNLVENFKDKDTQRRIRKIYSKGFPIDVGEDELSWMMVRDGCFLMAMLEEFSKVENEESNEQERQNSTMPSVEGILDRRRYHPLLNDIVKDMFKMENQLPMWVLNVIVQQRPQHKLFLLALKKLSPIEVHMEEQNQIQGEHILHMLHYYMVDKAGEVYKDAIVHNDDKGRMDEPRRCRRKACLSVISVLKRKGMVVGMVVGFALILLSLSPALILILIPFFAWLVISLLWPPYQACITNGGGTEESHVPTLEELKTLGIKFKNLEGRGVYKIKFDESSSTLYLPKFKVDARSEIILRNLIALEIYSDDVEKPITRYALLMNDLVNTSRDVAILRKYNIITSKLGSDDDVAKFWNFVIEATEMPTCEPIDKAASRINCYRKKRLKVLWAQFKMLYCSKPWLVLSMLAGTSLLMLTVVQVACLFRECQYHGHKD